MNAGQARWGTRYPEHLLRPAVLLFSLAVTTLIILDDTFAWGGIVVRHWSIDAGWTLGGILATAACAWAALRVRGRDRLVWLLFALGCGSWLAGQFAWDYYELFASFPPAPTLCDLGYLGLVPFGIAGFLVISTAGRMSRLLLWLDICSLGFAFGVLFTTIFWRNILSSPLSEPGRVTSLLYPVFYATLASSLLLIPVGRTWHNRSLRLLLLGLLGQAVPFVLWTPATLSASFSEGGPFDAMWLLGLLLIAASAVRFRGFPHSQRETQYFGVVAYLPIGFSVGAVLVRIADLQRADMGIGVQQLLSVLIGGIVCSTALRLALTVLGSRALVQQARATAEALQKSEQRFRAIFTRAPIGIEIADLNGRLVATNEALQQMLGYGEAELQGIEYTAITHPDDIGLEAELDDELIAGKRDHYQIEKRHVRKDGETIWTRLTASEVRGPKGEAQFAIGMVEDITEGRRAKEELEYQAMHDALTGLPNRALFRDRLEQALLGAERAGGACSLLLMDLNRFKEINDTFGHHYGDTLLQQVATRLVSVLRASDTVARLGGDEFAVVLPGALETDAQVIAAAVSGAFSQPMQVHGHSVHVDASVGIAAYPAHGRDVTGLLRQADIAMYVAKRAGTPFAVYDAGHDQESQRRIMLVSALREAIEEGGLSLHFQPKAQCSTREICGVEALIRWQHPVHGAVRPDEFIPVAENAGLIKPLTRWVLNEALRQGREWHEANLDIPIWVNLSARTLHDRDLPAMVAESLHRWKATPSRLGLEVTESAVMVDADRALDILQRLHRMGIQLSIDDFGTGYSSLSYLQRLPVTEIKIDRSFVMDMENDRGDRSIVQATINLAHDLDLSVVAEGVEGSGVWRALEELGCDLVQGYYLCRPLPAAEITPWLEAHQSSRRHLRSFAG